MFSDYIANGWHLCSIPLGSKGPNTKGWNVPGNDTNDPAPGAGLLHVASKTCAIDIDDLENVRTWLAEQGIDIDALLSADDAVKISSGRPNRAKLLYALDKPRLSRRFADGKLELRCATTNGLTLEDVLPPTIHPDTGQPYAWEFGLVGDWHHLPPLPDAIGTLWSRDEATPSNPMAENGAERHVSGAYVREALAGLDPDMPYDEWLMTGMALHNDTGGATEGFEAWDAWSSAGAKYKGRRDLESHWRSFTPGAGVTLGYLLSKQAAPANVFPIVTEEEPTKRNRAFVLRHVSELKLTAPNWLIENLMETDSLALVFGDPGVGKSFWAIDLACCIASGLPFHGHAVPNPGVVVYVAGEGHNGLARRFGAWSATYAPDATLPIWVSSQAAALCSIESAREVVAAVDAVAAANGIPKLVVLDTVARNFGPGDENSTKDMTSFIAAADALRSRYHTTILLVHHSGHANKERARGAMALKGALDCEYRMDRDVNGVIRMHTTKMKDGPEAPPMQFQLEEVDLGIAASAILKFEPYEAPEVDTTTPAAVAIALETMGGEQTVEELTEFLVGAGVNPRRIASLIVRAVNDGLVQVIEGRYSV